MLDFMYTGEYDDGERQELDAVYTSRNGKCAISRTSRFRSISPKPGNLAETNLDETLISSLSSPSAQQPDDNVTDDNVADDNAADDDTSGIPSLETKTMAMKQTLLRNVQVNAIADYYDVSPLKEHANTKIKKILETTWFADDFPEITKKVIESTGDKELHTIMGSTAAKHIEDLVELEDFVALEAMNDFTVGILRRMLSARETREKEFSWTLEDVLSQLESKKSAYDQNLENLRIANMQRDDESARAKDILSNMDDFIRMLSRQKFCRNTNCSQTFGCYVEKYGHLYKPMYRLRCSSCQCRHSV